jgi:hypothetical protein
MLMILSFLKSNWKLCLSIVLALGMGGVFLHKKMVDQTAELTLLKKTKDEEISKIIHAQEIQEAKHVENEKRLNDALNDINSKYTTAIRQLNTKRKTQIAEIVKSDEHNPDELARKLSEVTGFKVMVK